MTDKTEQLDEFQASMGDPSMVPEPTATGSTKRKADKTQGDKSPEKLTRAGMIAAAVGKLSGMDKNSVASAYSTMFGKGAPAGGGSAKNMATIKPKGMREDVEEMFEGEDLSEEFLDKATIVFEAAVAARCAAEVARLEEEYEAKLEEATASLESDLTEKVDDYVSYAATEWLKENEVAIESSIKVELAESFLNGMKSLFEQHNIEVSDEKIDMVIEADEKIEELEAKLDEEIKAKLELTEQIETLQVEKTLKAYEADLTATQQEKLQSMAEGIEYDNLEDFENKLKVIKETYFASKSVVTEEYVDEEPLDEAEEKAAIDPTMERYASAISRTVKR